MTRAFLLALATTVASGFAATAATPATQPLLPLSQRDMDKVDDVGCIFSFQSGRKTLFYVLNTTLTVRTKAGASICKLPEPAVNAFRDGKGSLTCGGQRLRVQRTGAIRSDPEADGSTQPMTLTVGAGRAAATLRGEASTAC